MSERATVDYWKDAKLGDLVWRIAGNETVFGNGERKGRGKWYLEPVTRVARKYMTVGDRNEFEKATGHPKTVNGFSPPDHAYGEIEKWLRTEADRIKRSVEDCRDPEKLMRIAAVMGFDVPTSPTP